MLEHVHGPAYLARHRELERAVQDYAETVAHERRTGSLSVEALDRLAAAVDELHKLRQVYIRGEAPRRPRR